jgi:exosome complex RNA-binding protein Rrp42 (RNase PH superfamily)
VKPSEGRGHQGSLIFKNDLRKPDHPSSKKLQDQIDTYLDKIIKGSKAISLESLSVVNQHVVWSLTIENTLLKDDGNILDTCYLATILSLSLFKKAYVRIDNKTLHVYD